MSLSPDPISQVKNICLAVIVVVVLGIIGYLSFTKARLETKLAQAQTDIYALTDANQDFKTQVEAANKALQATIDESTARAARAEKDVKTAEALSNQYLIRAREILRTHPDWTDCVATKKLFDSYFGGKK